MIQRHQATLQGLFLYDDASISNPDLYLLWKAIVQISGLVHLRLLRLTIPDSKCLQLFWTVICSKSFRYLLLTDVNFKGIHGSGGGEDPFLIQEQDHRPIQIQTVVVSNYVADRETCQFMNDLLSLTPNLKCLVWEVVLKDLGLESRHEDRRREHLLPLNLAAEQNVSAPLSCRPRYR